MTGLAVDKLMLPFEPETCPVMIEFFNSLNHLKGQLIMALTAVLAKLVLVGIFMAVGAVAVLNTLKMLELITIYHFNPMAFYTLDRYMLSQQRETGVSMVEF